MNDFNKGIEYAFDYIEKRMYGCVVNGRLEAAVLRKELEELRKSIPRKCDFCSKPCGTDWCPTKTEKKCTKDTNNSKDS